MEKLAINDNQETLKNPRAKNKRPLKVVYISTPMRVKATPEEFPSVVQRLTGQDSEVADPSIANTNRRIPEPSDDHTGPPIDHAAYGAHHDGDSSTSLAVQLEMLEKYLGS